MELFVSILFTVLFVSGVIRHIARTFDIISETREKALNRRLERFKH